MILWNNSIEVSEEDYDWWIESGVAEERDVESQRQADAFCEKYGHDWNDYRDDAKCTVCNLMFGG